MLFALIKLSATVNHRIVHGVEEAKQDDDAEEEVIPTVKVDQKKIFKVIAELIEALKDNHPEISLRFNL